MNFLEKQTLIYFHPVLAEHFRKDDCTVMESKQPMLNILELVFNSQGLPDWYLTNKYPLFNKSGDVIGVFGSVRPYGQENPVHYQELKWERDDEIGRAVSYIRNNFRSNIEIANLVEISGLNHRKLHRGFIELFGVAPMQFITRTRIEAACDDLLTTRKKLSQIAEDNGFYDQSSFTQHFRRQMKVTPLRYRKQKDSLKNILNRLRKNFNSSYIYTSEYFSAVSHQYSFGVDPEGIGIKPSSRALIADSPSVVRILTMMSTTSGNALRSGRSESTR